MQRATNYFVALCIFQLFVDLMMVEYRTKHVVLMNFYKNLL